MTERHEMDAVGLRVFGDATMSFACIVISATQNGREQKFPGRFVHLWLLRGGRWQIAGDMFLQRRSAARDTYPSKAGSEDHRQLRWHIRYCWRPAAHLYEKGDDLVVDLGGFQDTLTAESDSELFSKNASDEFTFVRNSQGGTHILLIDNSCGSVRRRIHSRRTKSNNFQK